LADGIYVKAQIGKKAALLAMSGLKGTDRRFLVLGPVFGERSHGLRFSGN
jgi:hypothetical protein